MMDWSKRPLPNRSAEADAILDFLGGRGIIELYHFTSVENLALIRRQGELCCKQHLEASGLWPCPEPGGDKLSHDQDKIHDNWDKVSLYYIPWTPMAYYKTQDRHLCFLTLRLEVAAFEAVLFTEMNAASNRCTSRHPGMRGLRAVKFDVVLGPKQPGSKEWRDHSQAEILVPYCIPLEFVERVNFVSEASRAYGQRLWGDNNHPPFEIDPKLFTNGKDDGNFNFSFLKQLYVTLQSVTKDNASTITDFEARVKGKICIVAHLESQAGASVKVTLTPGDLQATAQMARVGARLHFPTIDLGAANPGELTLTYYINDIRWFQTQLEVVA